MISFPVKALIGAGVVGVVGLGGYGIYYVASAKTIQQFLEGEGLTILSTDLNSSSDDSSWDEKVSELGDDSPNTKLNGYKKVTNSDDAAAKKANRDQVKKICKDLFESSSSDESKLEQAKKWCTSTASAGG